MDEIYERLRTRLDEMATGFPATETGVELKLLKRLFTPEDAEMFLSLGLSPETAREVALRTGNEETAVSARLESMASKGLLFRRRDPQGPSYHAVPFIVGIYEFQVNSLNPELLKDVSEYYLSGLGGTFHSTRTPHLRTIPINSGLVSSFPVAPYDDAVAIVERKDRIAVAQCFCRKAVRMYGKGCGHSLETCLQFDSYADYYIDNGMARPLSRDEALSILTRNEEEGLVIQVLNSQNVEAMCSCCSCCCGMLVALRLFPAQFRDFKSSYACVGDSLSCRGCGTCAARCPVGATKMKEGKPVLREEKCIGCGLCVTTCPEQARALVKKSPDRLYRPPESLFETFADMRAERIKGRGSINKGLER